MSYLNARRAIVSALCITCVVILTHMPQRHLPITLDSPWLQALQHVVAYSAMTAFVLSTISTYRGVKSLVVVLIVMACLAAADEITQPSFGRQAQLIDFGSNLAGITIVLAVQMIRNRFSHQTFNKRLLLGTQSD